MSRKATNEYIGVKRRAYADAKLERRIRILDEVCETTGYSRKHANRLLTLAANSINLRKKSNARTAKGIHANMPSHKHHMPESLQLQKYHKVSKKHSSDANPGSTALNSTIRH